MGQARINLSPVISNIQLELASYLKSNGSALNLREEKLEKYKKNCKELGLGWAVVQYPHDESLSEEISADKKGVMRYVGCMDKLTGERAMNIDLTNGALSHLQTGKTRFSFYDIHYPTGQYLVKARQVEVKVAEEKINIFELTKDQAEQVLNTLSLILKISKQNNQTISVHYQKDHKSTQKNKEAGSNLLKAWFKKTWFQSRANSALERAEKLIENFRKNHPAFAPSKQPSSLVEEVPSDKEKAHNNRSPSPRF